MLRNWSLTVLIALWVGITIFVLVEGSLEIPTAYVMDQVQTGREEASSEVKYEIHGSRSYSNSLGWLQWYGLLRYSALLADRVSYQIEALKWMIVIMGQAGHNGSHHYKTDIDNWLHMSWPLCNFILRNRLSMRRSNNKWRFHGEVKVKFIFILWITQDFFRIPFD